MLDALPLADEPSAGNGTPFVPDPPLREIADLELLAERIQLTECVGPKAAEVQLLKAVGEPAFEEAPVVGRRLPETGVSAVGDTLRKHGLAAPVSRTHRPRPTRTWTISMG